MPPTELHRRLLLVSSFSFGLAGRVAATAEPRPDKSGYSLANPTPAAWLRDLSTDRPDATESPFTVDAGHVQLEMDLLNHTADDSDVGRTREWGVAPFNVRLGVRDNFELGIFVVPCVRYTDLPAGGAREASTGFGDVTLRAKLNFRGNDGGESALGLIADLKLPTAAKSLGNGAVEGTLLLPVSLDLGGGWALGAMTGTELRQRETGGGRKAVWIGSATTGHDLAQNLAGYVELTAEIGDGAAVTTFDAGLTLKLGANTQLDAGAEFGLSRAADDTVFFVGLTRRY